MSEDNGNVDRLLGRIAADLSNVKETVEKVDTDIGDIKQIIGALQARSEDHTGRLHIVEERVNKSVSSHSKMTGIWIGASAIIGLATGGIISILLKLWR